MATKFEVAHSTRTNERGESRSNPTVIAEKPRKDGKGTELHTMADFKHGQDKEASEYASELKRETRGYADGGLVKAKHAAHGSATSPKLKKC